MSYNPTILPSTSIIGTVAAMIGGGAVLLPAAPQTTYTVVIPVYNKENTVADTLESVFKQSKQPAQVIIVDDASTDNSYNVLKRLKQQYRFLLIVNPSNIGKARSINLALTYVNHPYTLQVDADTVLTESYAMQMMRGFYSRRVKGVVGAVLAMTGYNNQTLAAKIVQQSREVELLISTGSKIMQSRILKGVWVLPGAASMWETAFLKSNPMPTDTFVEDMDETWAAQIKDYVNFNPAAVAMTDNPATLKTYVKQIKRWYSSGAVIRKRFWNVRLGIKTTVAWVFGESLLFLGFIAMLGYNLVVGHYASVALMIGVDLLISLAVACYWGRKFCVKTRQILKGMPAFYLLRLPNALYFWKSMVKPERKW